MRISDWSSDVCSSDLVEPVHLAGLDDHALRRVAGVDQGLVHQLGLLRRRTFVAGAGSQVNGNVDFIRTPHGRRLVPLCLGRPKSEEHTSELQSLMRISYAVFCLTKKNKHTNQTS